MFLLVTYKSVINLAEICDKLLVLRTRWKRW